MAGEIWLAIAAACVAGTVALPVAVRHLGRVRTARAYPAQHTGEQRRTAVEVPHEGVTETSPPIRDLPLAPPPPPIDPGLLLREAEAEMVRVQRRIEELRDLVQQRDERRLHIALDALQGHLVDRLRRAGNDRINTAEIPLADIRRIVRSGAPR